MSIRNEKDKRFAASSVFPSFFYASLGLVLGQVGAAQMHGSWSLHVFLGAPGIILLGLALFRARMHWQAATIDIPPLRLHALGWYVLLIAVGVSIGVLVSAGSVLLLGVVPALTYLFPWTRIPVCRARFVVSSLVMLAGAIVWIVTQSRSVQSLYFMIAAWILYVPSVVMHFLVLVSLDRGYRISASRTTEIPGLEVHG
jgi:hypothetical protein